MRLAKPQNSFAAGEFSPRLFGRDDVEAYFAAAAQLQNWLVLPFGGIQTTPGTKFVGEARDSDDPVRLLKFVFNTDQTYVIEMNDSKFRWYKNGARVVEAAVTITGITNANPGVVTAASHGYANGDDVVIAAVGGMTQVNGKIYRVANVAANTFELTDPQTGANINTTAYGTYTSGGTAKRIFTDSHTFLDAELFDIQYAQKDDLLYLAHGEHAPHRLARTADTSWSIQNFMTNNLLLNGPYRPRDLTGGDSAITITPAAATGANVAITASAAFFTSGMVGSVIRINTGWGRIDQVTNSTTARMDIEVSLTGTSAYLDWQIGAWNDEYGWPKCIVFHQGRLWFACNDDQPSTIWGSVLNEYENFDPGDGTDAADAVTFTMASDQANAIRWIRSAKGSILIGTSGGIGKLWSGADGAPITPENASIDFENVYGSHDVVPERIGSYYYYVDTDTRRVREIKYTLDSDSYDAEDITIYSDHITSGGIVSMAFQKSPFGVIWAVRDDGKIATLTKEINQKVNAWTEQTASGTSAEFEDVVCVPNSSGYDEVWFVVKRTINGATHRYIEIQANPRQHVSADLEDMICMQSALTYDGTPATTISGLEHLIGEAVAVLADGLVVTGKSVSASGTITLDTAASVVQVGLAVTNKVKLLPLAAGSQLGSPLGMMKKLSKPVFRVYRSLGLEVGEDGGNMEELFRTGLGALQTTLQTDVVEAPSTLGWEDDQQLYIRNTKPLPSTILSLALYGYVAEEKT